MPAIARSLTQIIPAALGLLLIAAGAPGQQPTSGGQPAAKPKVSRPLPAPKQDQPETGRTTVPATGSVELAKEAFRLESVGLTVHLPVNATAQSTKIGNRITAQIMPEDSTYLINIQTPQTSNAEADVQQAAEQTLSLLQGSVGVTDPNQTKVVSTQAVLLKRVDNLNLPGGQASRLYVSLPGAKPDEPRVVKGYTIFKPGATQFVVFELITTEPQFQRTAGIYETVVGSASFTDAAVLATSRGAAVKAGASLLERLTPADYEGLLDGTERWYRLYRPAASGSPRDAEEFGYRGVKFWRGTRGDVDPSRPSSARGVADGQEGYLARIRVRLLDKEGTIDSDASFFMTPDRNEETWLVKVARRDRKNKPVGTWTELGARTGSDCTVSVEESGKPGKTVKPLVQSEGYLNQVEAYLLAQLMIRAGVETEFGFYTYRSATGSIALRKDTLKRDGDTWLVKTSFREDDPVQTGAYSHAGELLRIDVPDETVEGKMWKPIEFAQLLELWKSKGLPTGEVEKRKK